MTPSTVPTAVALPVLLTVDEFMTQYGHTTSELVKGIVREVPMAGLRHGEICLTIGSMIQAHAKANRLGRVMSNDSFVKTGTNSIRGADVCYYSFERLPKSTDVPAGYSELPPDLVVEVRSPSDRLPAIYAKISEYLEVGVAVVILVDPKSESATIYRPEELHQTFHNGDELAIPDLLPGFAIRVRELFE